MKKVKKVNGFAIVELNDKEQKEYGFRFVRLSRALQALTLVRWSTTT
jgi:hypothetical protein